VEDVLLLPPGVYFPPKALGRPLKAQVRLHPRVCCITHAVDVWHLVGGCCQVDASQARRQENSSGQAISGAGATGKHGCATAG